MHGQQNVKMNNYFFCAGFEHVVYGPWDEVQFRVFLYLASIHFCLSVPRTDVTYLTHLVVWGNFFCFVLLCAYIRNLIPRPCVPFSRNVIRKRKICVKKRGGVLLTHTAQRACMRNTRIFLGAKRLLLASSCLSVSPSAWNNSAYTGRIFKKFDV